MARIHPTACIESSAEIADDAEIGPYCVIGGKVTIGAQCVLTSHVNVAGVTSVGPRTKVGPFCSLGTAPQSTGYRGGATQLVIGADCDLRENVTMNTGTEDGGGITTVGDRGLFMVGAHVGHDCHVGNNVTFANVATLGGHCVIGDYVVIGGLAALHQFTRIGSYAMIGGLAGVRGDVVPFALAAGLFAKLSGLNTVGMKRRGFDGNSVRKVRAVYHQLFFGEGLFAERRGALEHVESDDPPVKLFLDFLKQGADRQLCHPESRRSAR